jgi:hypothetical protein
MQRLLVIITLLTLSAVTFAGEANPLIDLSKVDASKLTATHATVTSNGDALSVRSDDARVQGTVQFEVLSDMRVLS